MPILKRSKTLSAMISPIVAAIAKNAGLPPCRAIETIAQVLHSRVLRERGYKSTADWTHYSTGILMMSPARRSAVVLRSGT